MSRRLLVVLGLATAAACTGSGPASDGQTPSASTAVPSGQATVPAPVGARARVSDCGGFTAEAPPTPEPGGACSQERLVWSYDRGQATLSVLDAGVTLNCCGERSIAATYDGTRAVVVLTETDRPGDGSLRCRCVCDFDFAVDIAPLAAGPVDLELLRHVTDEGDPALVWRGRIDTADGGGTVLIGEGGCPH
jgi:hypothetical protein